MSLCRLTAVLCLQQSRIVHGLREPLAALLLLATTVAIYQTWQEASLWLLPPVLVSMIPCVEQSNGQ